MIDTAPTGHTLLLLDATESYHKEVQRTHGDSPASVRKLLPRLRNQQETEVVIVTLPEATPVFEAERLQRIYSVRELITMVGCKRLFIINRYGKFFFAGKGTK